MKFYFFKSTITKDVISGISIFTNNAKKAYSLANNYFAKYKCKGKPVIIVI